MHKILHFTQKKTEKKFLWRSTAAFTNSFLGEQVLCSQILAMPLIKLLITVFKMLHSEAVTH